MPCSKFWLRIAMVVAIAGGLVCERILRASGLLPAGLLWSVAAYTVAAFATFVLFVVFLSKLGK